MFDALNETAAPKSVTPEASQLPNESRRLWSGVTSAIKKKDLEAATDAKSSIEDSARDQTRMRDEGGGTWKAKFFELKKGEYRSSFMFVIFFFTCCIIYSR
jgi:hypothetical protein